MRAALEQKWANILPASLLYEMPDVVETRFSSACLSEPLKLDGTPEESGDIWKCHRWLSSFEILFQSLRARRRP